MIGKKIKQTFIFECKNALVDCHYLNEENINHCLGCKHAKVIYQTPPEIITGKIEEREEAKQTDVF